MFAAIIFITTIFFMFTNKSGITISEIEASETYLDNYVYEAKTVINNARKYNLNVSYQLSELTEEFLSYSKDKGLNLGIIYLFSEDYKIHIVNYLNEPVSLLDLGTELNPEKEFITDYQSIILIRYKNETYDITFSHPEEIEFKTLLIQNV